MSRQHGDGSSFEEAIPVESVLDVFNDVEGPVVLSADIAEYFDCSTGTARRKLEQLHEEGHLDRRKVSQRIIYWRSERTDEFDAGGLRGDPTTSLDDASESNKGM